MKFDNRDAHSTKRQREVFGFSQTDIDEEERQEKIDAIAKLFAILFVIMVFAGVVMLFGYSIDKTESSECLKWQQQADVYPLFYLTKDEKVQCDAHKIIINAPVK